MPRRKPVSGKQHKAELQLKRAIKRGDVPSPAVIAKAAASQPLKGRRPAQGRSIRFGDAEERTENARRLESSFVKLSAQFLLEAKEKASNLPLPRPIPLENTVLELETRSEFGLDPLHSNPESSRKLTILRRPKWTRKMDKKQVESNEEGLFKKWLKETEDALHAWVSMHNAPESSMLISEEKEDEARSSSSLDDKTSDEKMPIAVPQFERNLEVWRQFWRVTEKCEIILVLLDSRCPLLHYPPTLQYYFSTFKQRRRIIFVLTKTDISGPERSAAWSTLLRSRYPNIPVVLVESYGKRLDSLSTSTAETGHRQHLEPHIPSNIRSELIAALKKAHEELLTPPQDLHGDDAKGRVWKPQIKADINWNTLLGADGGHCVPEVMTDLSPEAGRREAFSAEDDDEAALNYLSIGLIGQPNVGKSSLLNALFGEKKVKASKTPGKTKHFQTHFWTKDIQLVDCPGLVFPNFVNLELQVMAGILPVSQVSAIPSCVYYASSRIPLEIIFRLKHPTGNESVAEDKRTWRSSTNRDNKAREVTWTTMDILTSFAQQKGWITAKAGRPDVNRAGNAILRSLAEGKVRWSFLPQLRDHGVPSDGVKTSNLHAREEQGISISEEVEYNDDWNTDGSATSSVTGDSDSETQSLSDDDIPDQAHLGDAGGGESSATAGMFAALSLGTGSQVEE